MKVDVLKGLSLDRKKVVEFTPRLATTLFKREDGNINLDLEQKMLFVSDVYYPPRFQWFKPPEEGLSFKHIVLYLTLNCNMHCEYCFVNAPQNVDITEKMIENYFELIAPYSEPEPTIIPFGGEPTLRTDLIKTTKELADSYFIRPKINLVTNGVFNQETREKLCPLVDYVSIAYAGTEKLQMKWRPSKVPNNIKMTKKSIEFFSKNLPEASDVKLVFTKDKFGKIDDIVNELSKMKVKKVVLNNMLCVERGESHEAEALQNKLFFDNYFDLVEKLESAGISAIDRLFLSLSVDKFHLRCGAGYKRISMAVDGSLSACHVWSGKKTLKHYPYLKGMQIGQVTQDGGDLWVEKIREIADSYQLYEECKTCPIYPVCGSCLLLWRKKGNKIFMDAKECKERKAFQEAVSLFLINKYLR